MEAIQIIDEMNIVSRTDEDEMDDDTPAETVDAYEARLELYIRLTLSRASGSKRDDYKDSLVFQARKDLIMEFLKAAIVKKCTTCGA